MARIAADITVDLCNVAATLTTLGVRLAQPFPKTRSNEINLTITPS
jgi:hypothetical protein